MAPPRKAPTDRLRPVGTPEPDSFVEIVSGSVQHTEATLFAIDGERYTLTVPVAAGFTLKAMDLMAEQGETVAMMWLLRELIGQEGYDALKDHPDVTQEHLAGILDRLQKLAMGGLEDLGKS